MAGNGKTKWVFSMAIATLALLILVVGFATVVMFYPFVPVKYEKVELKNNVVKAGSYVSYTVYFTKYTDNTGNISRFLVSMNGDATINLTPAGLADVKKGENIFRTVQVWIPEFVDTGRYKIRWTVLYTYFGIRQVHMGYETPLFTVIKE